jgi:hypothetical protein
MRRLVVVVLLAAAGAAGCTSDPKPKHQVEGNRPSIGFLDAPKPEAVVGSLFQVSGWALDSDALIERVRIYLDDDLVATVPLTIMRPDAEQAFPMTMGAGTPHGFVTLIDAGSRVGFCTIRAEALDARGALTQFATTNVKIEP